MVLGAESTDADGGRSPLERAVAGFGEGLAYVVVLISADLQIEWASPSLQGATGFRDDQLVGTSAIDFLHPDDVPEVAMVLADELTTPHRFAANNLGAYAVNVVRIRCADGSFMPVEYAANNQIQNPQVNGILLVFRPVAERQLLDDVYDGMLSAAPLADVIRRVALLLSWQLGGRRVEVCVESIGDLDDVAVSAGAAAPGTRMVSRDVEGTSVSFVVHVEAHMQETAWFEVLLGRATRLWRLAVMRNVGEQRLREQIAEGEVQRRRAETLARALDEKAALMSAVSHDLSSPLAAIRIMSNLLDDTSGALTEVQRRQLAQRISNDAMRTTKLLTDLTSIDRLLGGSAQPARQPLAVDALLARVVDQADADEHVVRLAHDLAGMVCLGDPVLVERMLDNLVTNAVKYTPAGSLITIGAIDDPDVPHVHLYVDDDGPGLPSSMHEAVFDAYVRGEDTQQRPGSGIGLFLVRTFAEVQDGRAWYQPSPAGGSRFVVSLPRPVRVG
jgi:signal transduction histidine kinase